MKTYFDMAGLITFTWMNERWSLHLFLKDRKSWIWGHQIEPYDYYVNYWGLGPLLLIVRDNFSD